MDPVLLEQILRNLEAQYQVFLQNLNVNERIPLPSFNFREFADSMLPDRFEHAETYR